MVSCIVMSVLLSLCPMCLLPDVLVDFVSGRHIVDNESGTKERATYMSTN